MRLPEQAVTVPGAIENLEAVRKQLGEVRVRLLLADGSLTEGRLLSVSSTEVRTHLSGGESVSPFAAILAIEVAVPIANREFVIALLAILGGTVALVGYSLLPFVDINATDWLEVFGVIALAGAALWRLLLRNERFHTWLTRWTSLYSANVSSP